MQKILPSATLAVLLAGNVNAVEPVLETLNVYGQRDAGLGLKQMAQTGSRLGLSPMQTPASIEVLNRDAILRWSDVNLVAAVTRATGISSVAAPGNGGSALAARGFSGHGSVMQIYDGTRLYVGSGTVSFPFDPWLADRIEVLHGPASVLYGEGSMGGAINVVPKRPNPDGFEHELRLAVGNRGSRRAAIGSAGPLTSTLAYRVDLSYQERDGRVDDDEAESLAGAISLDWRPSEDWLVRLSHDYGWQKPETYFGTPLIDGHLDQSLQEANFNVTDSRIRYRDEWTRLDIQWQLSEAISLRSLTYRLTSDRLWRNLETYTWQPANGQVLREFNIGIHHDQQQWGNRTHLNWNHELAGLENRLLIGFEFNRIDFRHSNNSPYSGTSLVNPYSFDRGRFEYGTGINRHFDSDSDQYALFIEDHLQLSDRWSILLGLRSDRIEVSRRDLRNPSSDFSKSFDSLNGRLGVLFQWTPDRMIYGQYVTGTDPVGSLITTSSSNIEFDLSEGEQWELGFKQQFWQQRGEWTIAAYRIVKKDLISRDPNNPARRVQVGEQASTGVEVNLVLAPLDTLQVGFNLAALKAEYRDFNETVDGVVVSREGKVPTSVPERAANVWTRWEFLSDWSVDANWHYVGKRYTNTTNTDDLPSYEVMDLGLHWQVRPDTLLSLRVYNALDDVYAESGNSGQWLLGAPRTAEASVYFKF